MIDRVYNRVVHSFPLVDRYRGEQRERTRHEEREHWEQKGTERSCVDSQKRNPNQRQRQSSRSTLSFSVSLPHCLPSYSLISCSLIPPCSPSPPGRILAVLAFSLSLFSFSHSSLSHHSLPYLTGATSLYFTLCRLITTNM